MTAGPIPVVLAGARGHGRWHLDNIRRLQQQGLVRLAGVCELRPLDPHELDGFDSPAQSADFAALLDATGARIAVICTPIDTHTPLALTAARRGAHILLEKPPAPSYAEFRRMADGVREAGAACQIGFQSLGSHALPAIADLIAGGAIGEVTGIGAAGAWARDEAYFRRSPWAGKRRLDDGTDVVDGVLTNPLAHAVATALALDGSARADDVTGIELELARANDIEADDTSCVRITTARGTPVTVAVTLCAEQPGEPYVVVHGSHGRITLWYKQDRVLVQRAGHGPMETVHGRTDLLENLIAHVRDGENLLVPPDRTDAFMRLVEAVRTAPEPRRLPEGSWYADGDRRVVKGIDGLVHASADTLSLFSELESSPMNLLLRCAGRPVGRYLTRPDLAARLSPRPYLHPVTTLKGTPVTEERPEDHLHHLGVSVAVPDVAGHNFWGGRTFVRDQGPTELDNHGVQLHDGWKLRDPDGFVEDLSWRAGGRELLRERRTVAATELASTAWALDFTFSLTNPGPETLSIGSPATNGRHGAGYGGFFWRAPKEAAPPAAFTEDADGEATVHGRTADWLALMGTDWTLVFAGATDETRRDPWFVRTGEYPGVGSALAWEERLDIAAGDTVVRRVVTVVADGALDRGEAAALVRKALS